MIRKIDINSDEFQTEFELTKQFTNKVLDEHGFGFIILMMKLMNLFKWD